MSKQWPMHNNAFADAIYEQATEWVTRRYSGNFTDSEQQAFNTWLTQNEVHRTAYREVEAFRKQLSQIEPHIQPQLSAARAYLRKARRPCRIFSLQQGVVALALIGLMVASPYWWSWVTTDIYRTAKGEHANILLADGSQIELNTDTELSVQYTFTARNVKLARGEAWFSVVHNAEKPFEVIAAGGHIRDIGTQFNVYRQADQVSVTVMEGEVSVAAGLSAMERTLKPGQQVSYDEKGTVSNIASVDVADTTAWQKKQIIFKGQPLSRVLEQLSRYHDVTLQIPDKKLQALKVSGVFPTDNLTLALNTVASALPIKVIPAAARVFVIVAAD